MRINLYQAGFPACSAPRVIHVSRLPADPETAHARNLVDLSWAEFPCWKARTSGYDLQGLSPCRGYCTGGWRCDLPRCCDELRNNERSRCSFVIGGNYPSNEESSIGSFTPETFSLVGVH